MHSDDGLSNVSKLKSENTRTIKFHPHASNVLLSTSTKGMSVWDAQSADLPTIKLSSPNLFNATFGTDGTTLISTSKGLVQVWDVRNNASSPSQVSFLWHCYNSNKTGILRRLLDIKG